MASSAEKIPTSSSTRCVKFSSFIHLDLKSFPYFGVQSRPISQFQLDPTLVSLFFFCVFISVSACLPDGRCSLILPNPLSLLLLFLSQDLPLFFLSLSLSSLSLDQSLCLSFHSFLYHTLCLSFSLPRYISVSHSLFVSL